MEYNTCSIILQSKYNFYHKPHTLQPACVRDLPRGCAGCCREATEKDTDRDGTNNDWQLPSQA